MNKTELIDKIAAGAGLTKADAKKALEATTAAIKEALVAGDKVQLIGFGTFSAPLAKVSTPLPSRRLRLLPRRLPSSRLVLSWLMLSKQFVKENHKRPASNLAGLLCLLHAD